MNKPEHTSGNQTEANRAFLSRLRNNARLFLVFSSPFLYILNIAHINQTKISQVWNAKNSSNTSELILTLVNVTEEHVHNVQRNVFFFFQNKSHVNYRPRELVSLNDWCGTFWRDKKQADTEQHDASMCLI